MTQRRKMAQAEPCPICGRPAEPRFRPFCSKRCADVDLARWLNGSYAIPGEPAEPEDP
ncbi:MAG: DNA gyrase inhibitor YacG [Pseudomonadota bacterium]